MPIAFDLLLNVHDRVQVLAVAIEVAHEGSDSAFEVKGHLAVGALIHKADRHAAGDKRHFTEALDQRIEAIIDILGEDLLVELEGLLGAGLVLAPCRSA